MARRRITAAALTRALYDSTPRQEPGDLVLILPNPGNKLISHLGQPTRTKKIKVKSNPDQGIYGDYTCAESEFHLPRDWYAVNEEGKWGSKIVARQTGTERCVCIEHPERGPLAMSEVLN